MVAQTSSSSTTSTSKTTTATLSSASSSLCSASSSTSSSGPPYLKPVNIVSGAVGGAKAPLSTNPSAVNACAGKKVGAPKINFVGELVGWLGGVTGDAPILDTGTNDMILVSSIGFIPVSGIDPILDTGIEYHEYHSIPVSSIGFIPVSGIDPILDTGIEYRTDTYIK